MDPFEAGLWSMLPAFAFIAGSTLAPMLVGRFRVAHVMAAGFLVASAGFVVITFSGGQDDVVLLIIGYCVFSLGLAPVFTLATDFMMGAVKPEQAGTASGISETSSELGGALGIAILGSIVTAIYRSRMADFVIGGGNEISAAKNTLGGAVAIARDLPDSLGSSLLETAQAAFIQAFRITGGLCALVALAAAVIAAKLLHSVGPGSQAGAGGGP